MFYDVCEKCYAQSVAMKVCAFRAKIPTIFSCLQLITSSSLCDADIWLEETIKQRFSSTKVKNVWETFVYFTINEEKMKKVGKTTVEEGQSKWEISSNLYFLLELT